MTSKVLYTFWGKAPENGEWSQKVLSTFEGCPILISIEGGSTYYLL